MSQFPTPEAATRCYDNTKISQYKTCPRSYFLRHVMHWNVVGTALPLIFGLSWHDAQDIVWKHAKKFSPQDLTELSFMAFEKKWQEEGLEVKLSIEQLDFYAPRTPQIAKEMLYNYIDKRWRMLQESDVIAIEQPMAVPVPGMDGYWYIGRLDKVIWYGAQKLIIEHKTTTAYAVQGNFRTDYVESWFMAAQVKGYQFAGSLFYENVDAVWVDAALVHRKIHDGFKFIPIAHNFILLEEWLGNTKRWIQEIATEEIRFQREGKLLPGMFRKNEESCFGKYGACPFIDICRTIPDPTQLDGPPPGYKHEKWEPFSVLGLDKIVKENA